MRYIPTMKINTPSAHTISFSPAGMHEFLAVLSFLPDDHALRNEAVKSVIRDNEKEISAIYFQSCHLVRVGANWVQMDNGRPVGVYPVK